MAAGGDHEVGRADRAAGIEHQPGDLLAQGQGAADGVVIQAGHVLTTAKLGQAAQQRFEGRAGNVGHATAQLNHVLARYAADQLDDLLPLGNVHWALGWAADSGQGRQAAVIGDEVARLGPRRSQAVVFQEAVGLLHGAQADPMLDAQGAHRRQAIAGAVQALFDASAKQLGEVDVQRHGILRKTATANDQYR
ncbi:UNVERIFIED_ORG: hypothetical protein OKW25_005222 [Pseudomonas vranovensis]|nr:hypothetical protein [Pseudomonas vranovensis]